MITENEKTTNGFVIIDYSQGQYTIDFKEMCSISYEKLETYKRGKKGFMWLLSGVTRDGVLYILDETETREQAEQRYSQLCDAMINKTGLTYTSKSDSIGIVYE